MERSIVSRQAIVARSRWIVSSILVYLALIWGGGASAVPIGGVVAPEISFPTDSVTLQSTHQWITGGFTPTGVTLSWLDPTTVEIDVAVSTPGPDEVSPTVITGATVDSVLGQLSLGSYSYAIKETHTERSTGFVSSGGTLSGTFTVVPEPNTALLMGLGLTALARQRPSRARG